jgi:phosphohistidine phosphatase
VRIARNLSSDLVRLILVRHAHAESGEPDELRPLSDRGREEARVLGERLAAERPDAVISSPLLRARETAAAIAKAAGVELTVDDRLAPGASADDILAAVDAVGETVVTVGHQPDCSEITLALTGADPGFPTAGSYELDVS